MPTNEVITTLTFASVPHGIISGRVVVNADGALCVEVFGCNGNLVRGVVRTSFHQ
jgi:hypothetical protein